MRLPHKEPLLFAKKSLKSDKTAALVEIDFGYIPTLAMHIEAAAQAFSFVEIKSDCSWGVVGVFAKLLFCRRLTRIIKSDLR